MGSRLDQFNTRRYGGTVVQQSPTYVAPEYKTFSSDEEYRGFGVHMKLKEKMLSAQKQKADHYAAKAYDYRGSEQSKKNLQDRAKNYAANYERELAEYQAELSTVRPEDVARARKMTPQDYNTGMYFGGGADEHRGTTVTTVNAQGQTVRTYTPPGGARANSSRNVPGVGRVSVREVTTAEQLARQNDREQYRRAASVPGTYRLSDGSKIVSSSEVGDYGRYQVKTRKEVVGNSASGGYLYNTTTYKTQARITSGFNLFDMQTRAAVQASAGQFKTAGAMFGAAQASYGRPNVVRPKEAYVTPTFKMQMDAARARLSEAMKNYDQNPRAAGEAFLQPFITVPGGSIERWSQRGTKVAPGKPLKWLLTETEGLGRKMRTDPTGVTYQTSAALAGGWALGKVLGSVESFAVARYGAQSAKVVQDLATGVGVVGVGQEVMSAEPGAIGENAPGLIAGGIGFSRGYRSVIPRIEIERISRAGAGTIKYQRTPGVQITGKTNMGYTARVRVNGELQEIPFVAEVNVNAARQAQYRRSFTVGERTIIPEVTPEVYGKNQRYVGSGGWRMKIPKNADGFIFNKVPNRVYLKYNSGRGTAYHELGHAADGYFGTRNNGPGKLNSAYIRAGRHNTAMGREFTALQDAGYVESKAWFTKNYTPKEIPREVFAEVYKARRMYPDRFKQIAPTTDNWFAAQFNRNTRVDVTVPGNQFYRVNVRQRGTLRIKGKDYVVEGGWDGAMDSKSFFAKSGDQYFISRTVWSRDLKPAWSQVLAGERARASMSEFAVLKGKSFPTVERIGRGRTVTGEAEYNKMAFDSTYQAFVGRQKKYIVGNAAQNQFNDRGVNSRFFNEAFALGQRAGLYEQPNIRQRPKLSTRFDDAFFKSDADMLYSGVPVPKRAAPRQFQEPRFDFGPSYKGRNRFPHIEGLPFGANPTFNARSPVFAMSYGRGHKNVSLPRQAVLPSLSTGMLRVPSQTPRLRQRQIPRELAGLDTSQMRMQALTPQQSFKMPPMPKPPRNPLITDVVPDGPSVKLPPLFPGVGGAIGAGMAFGGGSNRKYRYTPSLVAMDFGIKRKKGQRKGGFTGLEVRGL